MVNRIEMAVEYYYPTAMQMGKKAKKSNATAAKRINEYAYQIQKLFYSAKHTENKDLLLGYTKDIELVYSKIKSLYEEVA